jgi:hypothetical protein
MVQSRSWHDAGPATFFAEWKAHGEPEISDLGRRTLFSAFQWLFLILNAVSEP